jgi:hypothetical protein
VGHGTPTLKNWRTFLSHPSQFPLVCELGFQSHESVEMGMLIYLHKHVSTVLSKTNLLFLSDCEENINSSCWRD